MIKDNCGTKKCEVCYDCYKDCIKSLKNIKDKKIRKELKHLFETLWINRCNDFDIIYYNFMINYGKKK